MHIQSRREYAARKQSDIRIMLLKVADRQDLETLDTGYSAFRSAVALGMPDEEFLKNSY